VVYDYAVFCILCLKTIHCGNAGVKQLMQHANGAKHKQVAACRFGSNQAHLSVEGHSNDTHDKQTESEVIVPLTNIEPIGSTPTMSNSRQSMSSGSHAVVSGSRNFLLTQCHTNQVTIAETKWILNVIERDNSFNSCDGIATVFKQMFPGTVSQDFSCGADKATYVTRFGLAPYFTEQLLRDVTKSGYGFALQFDETTTAQVRKQLDVTIRYWSDEAGQVVVRYLDSKFLGHAEADKVTTCLLESITDKGIALSNLVFVSSDGPNVNKPVINRINKTLTDSKLPCLVDVGFCNLHVIHNAFGKGLEVFGHDAETLSIELYYWFKQSAARREDLKFELITADMEEHYLIRHVPCRWFTLSPALKRICELWASLLTYFTKLSDKDKSLQHNERFKRIMRFMKDPSLLVEMKFLINVASLFHEILLVLQTEKPQIHALHEVLVDFYHRLLLRFLKCSAVGSLNF
jgi:hypothetical protein